MININAKDRWDYTALPNLEQLMAYIESGVPLGGFLSAVVSNNLRQACDRADDGNLWVIPIYAAWLYNVAPSASWGSPEKYEAWLKLHAEERAKRSGEYLAEKGGA